MKDFTSDKQLKGVSGWWNRDSVKTYGKAYNLTDPHVFRIVMSRQNKVLKFVDDLELAKGSKILELGYGPGHAALELGQRGFEIHGVDLSTEFSELATQKCKEQHPEGKYYFKVGNIESNLDYEDGTFDCVVIIGVLHYLYDDNACMKEVHRVLKPGGYMVVGQRQGFGLAHLTSIRMFARSCVYFLLREKHELFPSFKAILCDSKLGVIFGRYKNSKFMNSKFMLKGHDVWKYKLKKKLYSYRRLISLFKKEGFRPLKYSGVYYSFSNSVDTYELNVKIDNFLENLANKKFMNFVSRFAWIAVISNQKK